MGILDVLNISDTRVDIFRNALLSTGVAGDFRPSQTDLIFYQSSISRFIFLSGLQSMSLDTACICIPASSTPHCVQIPLLFI